MGKHKFILRFDLIKTFKIIKIILQLIQTIYLNFKYDVAFFFSLSFLFIIISSLTSQYSHVIITEITSVYP